MVREKLTNADFTRELAECRPAMRRFAFTLVGPDDADDVVQDAAVRAWNKWTQFDPSRGSPRAWLLAIVADQVRSRRRRRRAPVLTELPPEVLTFPDLDPAAIDVGHHVERLPDRQRAAVILFYYLDLSVAEMASVMGCAQGTVKSTLHDARTALERSLGGSYADQS